MQYWFAYFFARENGIRLLPKFALANATHKTRITQTKIIHMQKQFYSSPTTDIIEMAAENSMLAMSDVVTKNAYYDIYYGGEDGEFE